MSCSSNESSIDPKPLPCILGPFKPILKLSPRRNLLEPAASCQSPKLCSRQTFAITANAKRFGVPYLRLQGDPHDCVITLACFIIYPIAVPDLGNACLILAMLTLPQGTLHSLPLVAMCLCILLKVRYVLSRGMAIRQTELPWHTQVEEIQATTCNLRPQKHPIDPTAKSVVSQGH